MSSEDKYTEADYLVAKLKDEVRANIFAASEEATRVAVRHGKGNKLLATYANMSDIDQFFKEHPSSKANLCARYETFEEWKARKEQEGENNG